MHQGHRNGWPHDADFYAARATTHPLSARHRVTRPAPAASGFQDRRIEQHHRANQIAGPAIRLISWPGDHEGSRRAHISPQATKPTALTANDNSTEFSAAHRPQRDGRRTGYRRPPAECCDFS